MCVNIILSCCFPFTIAGPRQSNNRVLWVVLGVTLTAGIVIAVTVVVACRRTHRISRGAQQLDAGENVDQEEVPTYEAIRRGTEERTEGTVRFNNILTTGKLDYLFKRKELSWVTVRFLQKRGDKTHWSMG